MRRAPVLTAVEAAGLIPDAAMVSVSSSSALGCPDEVLRGIGERFTQTGSPHALTTVHPIAAGDMYGVRGIDHLARPGLLTRIVAGSYPSGPSSAEPPLIWQMIERDEVEARRARPGVRRPQRRRDRDRPGQAAGRGRHAAAPAGSRAGLSGLRVGH